MVITILVVGLIISALWFKNLAADVERNLDWRLAFLDHYLDEVEVVLEKLEERFGRLEIEEARLASGRSQYLYSFKYNERVFTLSSNVPLGCRLDALKAFLEAGEYCCERPVRTILE